ncbi:MAG: GNAT family N-acetyltransferase [Dysgonomonas sp.]
MNTKITIRKTNIDDFNDIMQVEKLAFGYDKEAQLVAELLGDNTAEPMLSLLAFHNGEAVGHILFTRAYFEDKKEQPMMHILAPLAIIPTYQRRGIGGMLISAGLEMLKEMGTKLVFVLGHKEYYPRYGFLQNAQGMGFFTPYPDPTPDDYADYWMVQSLTEDKCDAMPKGRIRCADTLNKPEHWRDEEEDRL